MRTIDKPSHQLTPIQEERLTERQMRNRQRAQEIQEKLKKLTIVQKNGQSFVKCQNQKCSNWIKMHNQQPITEREKQLREERRRRGLPEIPPHIAPRVFDPVPLFPDPLDHDKQVCPSCFDKSYRRKYKKKNKYYS